MNKQKDLSAEKAEETALKLLRMRRSKRDLENRLRQKGFPADIVAGVTEKMQRLGYINDLDYAMAFVHDSMLLSRFGPKKIRMSLYQHGIPGNVISCAMESADEEIYLDSLRFFMAKEFGAQEEISQAAAGKFQRRMLSRGFLMRQIETVMSDITITEEDYRF